MSGTPGRGVWGRREHRDVQGGSRRGARGAHGLMQGVQGGTWSRILGGACRGARRGNRRGAYGGRGRE